MENYNTQSFVDAVNQISSSIKGKYEDLVAMLQKQQTRLEPFVNQNGSLVQALQRRVKDLPDGDENGKTIVQGLIHFRDLYNTVVEDISILQKANDAEVSGDQRELASINDKVSEIERNIVTINDELNKVLRNPDLKGIAKL